MQWSVPSLVNMEASHYSPHVGMSQLHQASQQQLNRRVICFLCPAASAETSNQAVCREIVPLLGGE